MKRLMVLENICAKPEESMGSFSGLYSPGGKFQHGPLSFVGEP